MTTETNAFYSIRSQADIAQFLDRTNGLHDGFLIGVQYVHDGHTCGNPHIIDPARTELRLRYLVTSIYDATVELVFSGLFEWQLRDSGFDITDTSVNFDNQGRLVWTDDSAPCLRDGSYVIAQAMKWRFL